MSSHENVIEVSFSQQNTLAEEIELLLDLDDPLEELLNEFDDHQDETSIDPFIEMNKSENFKLSFKDTPMHMTDTLIKQMGQIKEDINRLSYYLDEMNIDQ
ncbi:MAG: hypothetical protein CMH26_05790 [Micavibrio sp.]|nr:hypothetical protein [Micavibrio sp.]